MNHKHSFKVYGRTSPNTGKTYRHILFFICKAGTCRQVWLMKTASR